MIGSLVGSLLVVPAAAAQEADVDDLEQSRECELSDPGPLEVATEAEAQDAAMACGVEVEILAERTEFGEVHALPDGSMRISTGVEPVRAIDDSGEWAPIDPTLAFAADGSVRPANVAVELEFSGGGSEMLAHLRGDEGGAVGLDWPEDLPVPRLAGDTATYAGVLPDVDLVVQALPTGFRHDLVVRSPEAGASPELERIEFDLSLDGAEAEVNEAGGVSVLDTSTNEEIAAAATPLMWDAGAVEAPALETESQVTLVGVEIDGDTLALTPDLEMLRDPKTVYPVVIDPLWTGTKRSGEWATVSNRYPSTSYWKTSHLSNKSTNGDAGVGQYCDSSNSATANCTSTKYRMRSFFRMNTETVTRNATRSPYKATFKILQRHSAVCSNGTAQVERTGGASSSTTWNNQPSWSSQRATTTAAKHGRSCSGADYVSFNVLSMVNSAEANNWYSITIGMRARSESPSPDLAQWNRYDSATARLEIHYYVEPPLPDQLKVNGGSCASSLSAAKWTTSRYPVLSARVRTRQSESVYARFRTRKSGASSNFYYWRTPSPVSAATRSHTATKSHPDGNYHFQARADSRDTDSVNSGYTSACYFKVDATKPSTPTVTASRTGVITEGESLSFTLSSTDPVVNGVRSGLKQYEYSWNTNTFSNKEPASGSFTITRNKVQAGRYVLYVRARDNAGNLSSTRTYTFFVGRDIDATLMGAWRFDGDVFDDAGNHNRELEEEVEVDGEFYVENRLEGLVVTDPGGVGFTTDVEGRPGAAVARAATGCLETEQPVIETDAAYTVTAWAYITDNSAAGNPAIVTQAGQRRPAFHLEFHRSAGTWNFSSPSQDADTVTWQSLHSTSPAQFGVWTHVAATMDPDAQLARIYINGELENERALAHLPWRAEGPLLIGCAGRTQDGDRWHQVDGAIDQVGVWQGLLSPADIAAAAKDLPAAFEQARWTFRDGGTDASPYGRHLDLPEDIPVGEDAFERPSGSVQLDGQTCLEYPEPVVTTDRSFTVASWVRFEELGRGEAIAVAAGEHNMGFQLRKLASDRIEFRLTSRDAAEGGTDPPTVWSLVAPAGQPVTAKRWYHVAGRYDAVAGQASLYVDGIAVASQSIPQPLWAAGGPVILGCDLQAGNGRGNHLRGSLHDVRVWRGPVDADQIATMMGSPPAEAAASWDFEWIEDDGTQDHTGNGHYLTYHGSWDWDLGMNWRADSALRLDGAGHGATAGPVLTTDESYTVSAWVWLRNTGADQVIVSQSGPGSAAFSLRYRASAGRWEMAVPRDPAASSWTVARSEGPADFGEWVQLVGVFDLAAGEVSLYLDGVHQQTVKEAVGFHAPGPFVVGTSKNSTTGATSSSVTGLIDDVSVWQGTLSETVIANMFDPELGADDES